MTKENLSKTEYTVKTVTSLEKEEDRERYSRALDLFEECYQGSREGTC